MPKALPIDRPHLRGDGDSAWRTAKVFLSGFFLGECFLVGLIGLLSW